MSSLHWKEYGIGSRQWSLQRWQKVGGDDSIGFEKTIKDKDNRSWWCRGLCLEREV